MRCCVIWQISTNISDRHAAFIIMFTILYLDDGSIVFIRNVYISLQNYTVTNTTVIIANIAAK
jgi:hypothetical protein